MRRWWLFVNNGVEQRCWSLIDGLEQEQCLMHWRFQTSNYSQLTLKPREAELRSGSETLLNSEIQRKHGTLSWSGNSEAPEHIKIMTFTIKSVNTHTLRSGFIITAGELWRSSTFTLTLWNFLRFQNAHFRHKAMPQTGTKKNNSPYFDESLVVDSFLSCSKISETSFIHMKICV